MVLQKGETVIRRQFTLMYIGGSDDPGSDVFYDIPDRNRYILVGEYLGFNDPSESRQEYGNI